jgi:hypothetical protein
MGAALRTVRVIQVALLVSIGIYAAVGEAIGTRVTADIRALYAIPFAAISLVGVILVVRKTMVLQSEEELKRRPGDLALAQRWKTGYIVTYLLCELLALFGLLLRIMGSTLIQVWPYYAGSFVLLLLFWPSVPRASAN